MTILVAERYPDGDEIVTDLPSKETALTYVVGNKLVALVTRGVLASVTISSQERESNASITVKQGPSARRRANRQ